MTKKPETVKEEEVLNNKNEALIEVKPQEKVAIKKKVKKSKDKLPKIFFEKLKIILISNKMLDKRLKPRPHFSEFLSSLMIVDNHVKGESMLPEWLDVDHSKLQGTFKKAPDRIDLPAEINESLIVELYSK